MGLGNNECDVNADKAFDSMDVSDMQKYILDKGELADRQAGDLCGDNRLNADITERIM